MIDSFPDLTIIATGSSAFDMTNQTGEPLTGRRIHFDLFPLAQVELGTIENSLQTRQQLEDRLIFGSYPEVVGLATIDLLEQQNGHLAALEFKWQNRRVRVPGSFGKAYPAATFSVVHQDNYLDFVILDPTTN